tara:strand:- start:622 stop:999 length:378 start_codon:yes stop_codon:yes gene_type:complete
MASILRVNTITDASSNNSTAVSKINQGTASMWAKATQSDNSIFDSYNLTSITDDGTGQTTFTIASDMANVNYTMVTTTQVSDCGGLNAAGTASTATGSCTHQGRNTSGTDVDSNPVSVVIHGDLA